MNVAEKKAFDVFRILGIIALFCTVLLWAGLWIYSGTTSSSGLNNSMSDSINDKLDLDHVIEGSSDAQYIRFSQCPTWHYNGETGQLSAVVYPSNSIDTEFEYSSSNPNVAEVDETGKVTFKQVGSTSFTAKLKNHPEITYSEWVSCLGIKPSENDGNNTFPDVTLKQWERVQTWVNGGYTDKHSASYTSSNPDIATIDRSGIVSGKGVGETTITAKWSDGYELSCKVTVTDNPDFTPAESITLVDDFNLRVTNTYNDIRSLVKSIQPAEANECAIIHVKSSNTNIAYESDATLCVVGCGEVTLTFYTDYDPSVCASKTVYIPQLTPTDVHVSAPNVLVPHKQYQLSASLTPVIHSGSVKWEVIEGEATINENGVLVPTFWGKIVVRCSSTLNPDVYMDVTMSCQLFDSAYYFVRKLMGHFGLSALLGFGIFCTIFVLDKRKWMAFVATPVLSFAYSGISEIIQYFTPGRYCTWTDVLTDFAGTMIGMVIAIVMFILIAVIWLINNKKSFDSFKYMMKYLNIHNAWQKTYVADEYVREIPDNTQEIINDKPLAS